MNNYCFLKEIPGQNRIHLDKKSGFKDPNLEFIYSLGLSYYNDNLILGLNTNTVAQLIDLIDEPLIRYEVMGDLSSKELEIRLNCINSLGSIYIKNINANKRVGILLRLWTGCIIAAKTIGINTNRGGSPPLEWRIEGKKIISELMNKDYIFKVGVYAAEELQKLRGNKYMKWDDIK